MTFYNLPNAMQDVVLFNYDQFGKLFFFFIFFSVALIYKFYWKPYKQQMTAFFSIAVLRVLLDKTSTAMFFLSPFFIILLHPAYSFGLFGAWFTSLFSAVLFIFASIMTADILRLGFMGVAQKIGMDFKDEMVNKFLKDLDKNTKFWR